MLACPSRFEGEIESFELDVVVFAARRQFLNPHVLPLPFCIDEPLGPLALQRPPALSTELIAKFLAAALRLHNVNFNINSTTLAARSRKRHSRARRQRDAQIDRENCLQTALL